MAKQTASSNKTFSIKNNAKRPTVIEQQLKQKKLQQVYFLFGKDEFLIKRMAEELEAVCSDIGVTEFDKALYFGNDESVIEKAVDFCDTFPLGDGKKLCIIKQGESVKNWDKLESYIKDVSEFSYLIISFTSEDKEPKKSLAELLVEKGYLFFFDDPNANVLVKWVIAETAARGKVMDEAVASDFVDMVGNDRAMINMQLEKILTFLGDRKEVHLEDVESQVVETREDTIFMLADALIEKDRVKALTILKNLMSQMDAPEEAIQTLGYINKFYNSLMMLQGLRESGASDYEIARRIGTHHFFLPKYFDARARYNDVELANAIWAIHQTDFAFKTGGGDPEMLMNLLIAKILPARVKIA